MYKYKYQVLFLKYKYRYQVYVFKYKYNLFTIKSTKSTIINAGWPKNHGIEKKLNIFTTPRANERFFTNNRGMFILYLGRTKSSQIAIGNFINQLISKSVVHG